VRSGVTSWVKTWKLNGWRLKSGGPIINKEDFVTLDRLNAQVEVVWVNMLAGSASHSLNDVHLLKVSHVSISTALRYSKDLNNQ